MPSECHDIKLLSTPLMSLFFSMFLTRSNPNLRPVQYCSIPLHKIVYVKEYDFSSGKKTSFQGTAQHS